MLGPETSSISPRLTACTFGEPMQALATLRNRAVLSCETRFRRSHWTCHSALRADGRQLGSWLETGVGEVGQIGNGKSAYRKWSKLLPVDGLTRSKCVNPRIAD